MPPTCRHLQSELLVFSCDLLCGVNGEIDAAAHEARSRITESFDRAARLIVKRNASKSAAQLTIAPVRTKPASRETAREYFDMKRAAVVVVSPRCRCRAASTAMSRNASPAMSGHTSPTMAIAFALAIPIGGASQRDRRRVNTTIVVGQLGSDG